jgi:hypothetical protein
VLAELGMVFADARYALADSASHTGSSALRGGSGPPVDAQWSVVGQPSRNRGLSSDRGRGRYNEVKPAVPSSVIAVGHDLRNGKGAPLDDIFFERPTKPIKRPPCSGGRVQVRCE